MMAKFEIEKFNGKNFSLWKLKIKAVLRKDNCFAAIGEKAVDITNEQWNKIDENAIVNIHLALTDEILTNIEEKRIAILEKENRHMNKDDRMTNMQQAGALTVMRVLSLGGVRYFMSFIDDYSRRCWVYPIKRKTDVFEIFKVRLELEFGKKIKCLRTDNGGEYTSSEFCKYAGIKRQYTTTCTLQQNGVTERMNRTLLERTRAMLGAAGLDKSF
ncbi:hypothetical protein LIER_21692 [Lithospermum erythrorhizon]|uniref:Integrase catalytic domain-containing protein n=1 Tax=Lithospermum erythrorhizon TaxID=34254 RepID=A0AAV3QU85_LITER